jgi:hypothetical protein
VERHIERLHRYTPPVIEQPELPRPRSGRKALRACPRCGAQVREDRLEKHLTQTHPPVLPTNEVVQPKPESNAPAIEVRKEEPLPKPDADLSGRNPTAPKAPVLPVSSAFLRCPKCRVKIRGDRMREHLSQAHAPRPDVIPENVPTARPLAACPRCGAKVREDCMGLHFISCHSPADEASSFQAGAHRLPFVLLPPGTWDIRQVVEHYRKISQDLPRGRHARQIDPTRLEKIQSLKPIKCYIGKESWLGYVVFEFSHSVCVVLECPVEGNATYVLFGDWKTMVNHTKAEIRHEFADSYTRIVHKGDWLSRLRVTLRESRSSRP